MPSTNFLNYEYYWKIKHKGNAFSFLKDSFPANFPSLKTIPTTAAEKISIILSLKTKNSADYDEIKSKILKTCATVISHPLSFIFNHLIYTNIFSDHLKITIVKPLYKKGDKYSMKNCRPIFLLTVFSKVGESRPIWGGFF
jgi:hypothetical protein